MIKSTATNREISGKQVLLAGISLGVTLALSFGFTPQARAQGETSLRNPLIPGAPYAEPNEQPSPGQPPPVGDGDTPAPVTPGHEGAPIPPPSDVPVPPSSPLDSGQVDGAVAPYLTPPPSTPGEDPGLLPGTTSGYKPPALQTDVQPQGGLSGDAPIHHWGGQTSRDFGLNRNSGAQTTDFGQPLQQVAAVRPQPSEDGPRGLAANGAPAQPNLAGAQQSSDLYGNRTLFKGNQRAVMTIAPY